MTADRHGVAVVDALGEPEARELLEAITRSDADRAALIGRLYARADGEWLAELLSCSRAAPSPTRSNAGALGRRSPHTHRSHHGRTLLNQIPAANRIQMPTIALRNAVARRDFPRSARMTSIPITNAAPTVNIR